MYRVLARSEEGIELVREYTPCRRTIKFYDEYYTLNFPYIIFLNKGFNTCVAFSPKPIRHILDHLYMPPMGNIYDDWNVCGCETDVIVYLYSRTDRLKKGIEKFWQSTFSTDGWGHKLLLNIFREAYLEWSLKTPEEILKEMQYENDILEIQHDDEYRTVLTIRKTFEDFLNSDRDSLVNYMSRLQMLPVHKITLDSEYEQIKISPQK